VYDLYVFHLYVCPIMNSVGGANCAKKTAVNPRPTSARSPSGLTIVALFCCVVDSAVPGAADLQRQATRNDIGADST